MVTSALNLKNVHYKITQPGEIAQALERYVLPASVSAADTETTGDDPYTDKIVLIQIAALNQPVLLIPTTGLLADDVKALKTYFSNPQLKLFQNGKFDVKMLKSMGINVTSPIFDTMLASRILSCGQDEKHDLAAIALKYLKVKLDKSLQESFKDDKELTHEQCLYGAIDPLVLLYLHPILQQKLKQFSRASVIASTEFELVGLLAQAEYKGASIWWDQFHNEHVDVADRCLKLEETICQTYSKGRIVQRSLFSDSKPTLYDVSKPADVKALLEQQDITVKQGRVGTKAASQSIDDLLLTIWENYPLVEQVLRCRRLQRLHNVYVNMESDRSKLHPTPTRVAGNYVQVHRLTGELGESRTGIERLMNDPDTPPAWLTAQSNQVQGNQPNLVWLNLHQLEFRVLAQVSRDERLVQLYQRQGDFYQDIIESVITPLIQAGHITVLENECAPLARAIALAVGVYGWGEQRLQRHAYQQGGVLLTKSQAKQLIKRFRAVYCGITQYHQDVKDYIIKAHTTLWGRYRHMKKTSPDERSAYLIQGSASDLIKQCLLLTHKLYPSPQMQVVLVLKQCVGIEVSSSCLEAEVLELLCLEWAKVLQQSITLVPCPVVNRCS